MAKKQHLSMTKGISVMDTPYRTGAIKVKRDSIAALWRSQKNTDD